MSRPKISIAVPYHNTPKTAFFLSRLLESVEEQTFTDYEIVLTQEGAFAENHNAAILKSKGELVKMLQMDDYFAHPDALQKIVDNFSGEWMISACIHEEDGTLTNPHFPSWTDDIITGNNRLGSVSTLTIKRDTAMLFEEGLTWVVDCDLYKRYYDKHGLPTLLNAVNVVIDVGEHRLSSTLTGEQKRSEIMYLCRKYENN